MGLTFSSLKDNELLKNDFELERESKNYILRNIEINKQIELLKTQSEDQKRNIYDLNEKLKNIESNHKILSNQLKLENKHLKIQLTKNKDIKQKQNEIIQSISQLIQSINTVQNNNEQIKNLSSDIYQYKVFVSNISTKNKLLHSDIKSISNRLESKYFEINTIKKSLQELHNASNVSANFIHHLMTINNNIKNNFKIYSQNEFSDEKVDIFLDSSTIENISYFPDAIERKVYKNVYKIIIHILDKYIEQFYHNTLE